MTGKKKLIEVSLPLEAINLACQEDKDRKTGHVRNLHKWFAPMPLAAMRAIVFSSLVDDPGTTDGRERLHKVIKRLVQWQVAENDDLAEESRTVIRQALAGRHVAILDPFCGGGSTLLESQRLGIETLGSDLNPIPVLITSTLTDVARFSGCSPVTEGKSTTQMTWHATEGLKADIMHYARRVYDLTRMKVGHLYPRGPDGNEVIAWRWARTVPSPDPRFQGATTPLISDWWLSRKPGDLAWLLPVRTDGHIEFEIRRDAGPPPSGNAGKSKGYCLLSDAPIPLEYVREAGKSGHLGHQMIAVVTKRGRARDYFLPDATQLAAAASAVPTWVPDIPLDDDPRAVSPPAYGLMTVADLFTRRQLATLAAFCDSLDELRPEIVDDCRSAGREGYESIVRRLLAISIGRLTQYNSTLSLWRTRVGTSKVESGFSRNDIPITWDYAEANPFAGSVGDYMQVVETSLRALDFTPRKYASSTVRQLDARAAGTQVDRDVVVITDPPYFDQIPYAALSDFFYPWLRHALGKECSLQFSTLAAPKAAELVANPYRHGGSKPKAREFFVEGFVEVFRGLAESVSTDWPMVVIYANRQQETVDAAGRVSTGWDAMLDAMLRAGWSVEATWPVRGTGTSRQRGIGSNALATYVVLVCRHRPLGRPLGTRADFVRGLRQTMPQRISDMQAASIAPVDLAQAAIGPGIGVFSRFERVVEADGSAMSVRASLGLINQVVDEIIAEQESDFDSDTRWALAWFESAGTAAGEYGLAESLSKAKNTSVAGLVQAGLLESKGGRVRLLDRSELPDDWEPSHDSRLTVWEITQQLIRALEQRGELSASELLRRLGGLGEAARELAYRLYTICERKKWAREALAYNALVVAWPEIARLASGAKMDDGPTQERLL